MNKKEQTITVLGASPKEERYSNKAVKLLLEHGYNVIPVNPAGLEVCGVQSVKSLEEIDVDVDVLTMYVNSMRSSAIQDEIIALSPGRIIFNPGSENEQLADACRENGIEVEEACTLILLNTGQF
jgi:predicted CoA-binding protein